ncbi:hypothetical protein QZH41_015367 [Actinostola sp. cb2023]|nr:hypothetical protein QZH41_015367 [Actinostola sp. cb2023]
MACLVASLPLSTVNHLNKQMASKPKPYVMEIPVGKSSKKKAANLQEAFEKFRKGRQREMKMAKVMEERALAKRQDDVRMEMLRTKFLEGVKKYFGVPYAKRYHDEVSPYHNAPLFLDCCGLIRRVLLGLKEDFGFTVGGGNQSYMFDTLPMDIKQDEMKPGDLVFISATYYNIPGKKWKQQRHDMVHVEVWAGDDEKTIGARWQKGIVQVFDSYKFVSKSYHSMKFHFKSIDTWLMGICKSFCPEHPWRSSKYDPGKKSIFSEKDQEEEECQAAEEQEDDDQQQNCNMKQSILSCHSPDSRDEETCEPGANTEAEKHVSCLPSIDVEDRVQNITLIQACAEDESLSHDEKVYSDDSETIKLQDAENVPQQTHNECNQNSECKTTFESEDFNRATKTNNYCIDPETTCCICPECSPSYRNCIHTRTAQDSEETSADLTTSKDRTTSLECFEVIASLECREQVEQAIISCPVEKAEQHGMIGGNSNDEKPRRQDSKVLPSSNGNGNKKNKDSPPKPVRDSCRSRMRYMGRQPAFYVSPGNGSSMVEATLVTLGWRKLDDRYDDSFKLKWVECKSQIDYKTFREGDQLVNHISNIGLLTTKLGLLCSLEEYERVLDKVGSRLRIQLSEFVPETLKLTNMTEKQKFVNEIYKEGEVWICKPVGQNQGKGIYMINSSAQLRDKLHLNVDANAAGNGRRSTHIRPPQGRIIQRGGVDDGDDDDDGGDECEDDDGGDVMLMVSMSWFSGGVDHGDDHGGDDREDDDGGDVMLMVSMSWFSGGVDDGDDHGGDREDDDGGGGDVMLMVSMSWFSGGVDDGDDDSGDDLVVLMMVRIMVAIVRMMMVVVVMLC